MLQGHFKPSHVTSILVPVVRVSSQRNKTFIFEINLILFINTTTMNSSQQMQHKINNKKSVKIQFALTIGLQIKK